MIVRIPSWEKKRDKKKVLESIDVMKRAVPCLRFYRGRVFVVKVGGAVLLGNGGALDALCEDIAFLGGFGIRMVIVHGGAPQTARMYRRLGIRPALSRGLALSDTKVLEVRKMVCGGTINIDLVARLRAHGIRAVGLCGVDAGLIEASRCPGPPPAPDARGALLGSVGDVGRVDADFLSTLMSKDLVPVIAPLASDARGEIVNVSADAVASAVARALNAEKLLILTPGGFPPGDGENRSVLLSGGDMQKVEKLKASGELPEELLAGVSACMDAVKGGVRWAHLIDGTRPAGLLVEVFSHVGASAAPAQEEEPSAAVVRRVKLN